MRRTGTVTFLFTDVEGSTSAWEAHPDAMAQAIVRHDAIVRAAVAAAGGGVFSTAGDSFAAAFTQAVAAARAALDAQRALAAEPWPPPLALRVRMGLHTGDAVERDGDFAIARPRRTSSERTSPSGATRVRISISCRRRAVGERDAGAARIRRRRRRAQPRAPPATAAVMRSWS